jgi:ubiquinone/menaquinone biosynthesis C-methylase UbiE
MKTGAGFLSLLALSGLVAQDAAVQQKFFSEVHQALQLKPGSVVADIGTGDDPLHPLRMASVVGPSGRVLCIDIDQKALDKLKRNLPPGTANIEVRVGTTDDPMLGSGSVDAVLVSYAYHEMTEHEAMLRRIRTALRPGGRLVVIEAFVKSNRHLPREEQAKKHELAPEFLEDELRATGFEIVSRIEPLLIDGTTIKYLIAASPLSQRP